MIRMRNTQAPSHTNATAMGVTKNYFKNQFRVDKLTLNHEEASDFYLSWWQTGSSAVHLLCLRLILFLGCIGIFVSSLTLSLQSFDMKYWPIYMTHWGVFMIMITSGLAFMVSVIACFKGSIDSDTGLPWYVRVYWASLVASVPVAYFITIFYYSFLSAMVEEYAVDPVLDFFIHGMNSIVLFVLLMTSKHPMHLLQFVYPLGFALLYMAFSIIYYYAGGTSPHGDPWVYPMLDWSDPGPTVVVVIGSAVLVIITHTIGVLMALFRDYLVSTCFAGKRNSMDLANY